MSTEEATRWCQDHQFFLYSFKIEDRTLWDLSGWAWRKNGREKERIHRTGSDLIVMVQWAKNRFEELQSL